MQIPVSQDGEAVSIKVRKKPNSLSAWIGRLRGAFRRTNAKFLPRPSQRRNYVFRVGLVVGFFIGYAGLASGIAYANQAVQAEHVVNHAVDRPIRIVFNRPIHNGVKYSWQESLPGSWRLEKQLGTVRALVFTPRKTLSPNTLYHLTLSQVTPFLDIKSNTPREQVVNVIVERAPRVVSQSPKAKSQQVKIDSELAVTLSSPNRGLRSLELVGDVPVVSKKPSSKDEKTFYWKLQNPLEQGKSYHAEVLDAKQPTGKQTVAVFDFTSVFEPKVTSDVAGFIGPNHTMKLSFDQDMVQSDKAVSFTMPGKGSWTGPRTFSFTSSLLGAGSSYEYKVLKGAASIHGGVVAEDRVFYAQTPGNVKVLASQPSGSRIPLGTSLSLTFDQAVDRASAENAFYMQPQVKGSFSWSGNTMSYRVSGLGEQVTYTYGVTPGIKPVFGLSGVAFSRQFTTVPPVRKLAVPFFKQAYTLSCEAASLRMALAYYGVGSSDMEILQKIGYAPQPRDTATNTWQDPNVEFVGDVNGKLGVTGWGVYAGPVAKAARSYGRSADVIYSPSVQNVAAAIHAGRPVVVWGVMGWSAVPDSWNTATSGVVQAAKNQHVRVAYGVEGTADNPIGFFIHDPIRGSVYLSAEALQASMNGGGRQVLTVY